MRQFHFDRLGSPFVALMVGIGLVGLAAPARAATVYVMTTGLDTNDGQSWATAKKTVTAGLNVAVAGDQVWVAAGKYVERITLKSDVALYGGFAGTETLLAERNWAANLAILDGTGTGNVSVVTSPSGATANTRIDGFTIRNGKASMGAGISCSTSSTVIANNTIMANVATGVGGGIATGGTGTPTIINNRIVGNTAGDGGGVYCTSLSTAVICNNTIIGNLGRTGGGIYFSGTPTFSNNIVAYNSSGLRRISGTPTLTANCVYNPDGANYTNLSPGAGDISVDPQLLGVEYGEVHLKAGSPCIDAGSDAAVPPDSVDIDGQARIQNGHVDIGADEYDGTVPPFAARVVYVTPSGIDANSGATWALAKRTVQAGIDAAADTGGEVWVAAGTYSQRITLKNCVQVYSGFAGTETAREQRDRLANVTILDGAAGGSVVTASSLGHRVCRIDGFTIRNGTGTLSGSNRYGGGIYCLNAAPIISGNLITGNTVIAGTPSGGGIYCAGACAPVIQGNTISGNSAAATTAYGGGVYCATDAAAAIVGNTINGNTVSGTNSYGGGIACYSAAAISGNTIRDNSVSGATRYGGGLYLLNSPAVISGNDIVGNKSASSDYYDDACGGGAYCEGSTPTISQNLIRGNVVAGKTGRGAGVYCTNTTLMAYGNYLEANVADDDGGGICCVGGAPVLINNTMLYNLAGRGAGVACSSSAAKIWNNILAFGSSGVWATGGTPALSNNCVYNPRGTDYTGLQPGAGDISVDPLIPDARFGRVHLAAGSPCIDAGYDAAVQAGWTDVDGEARVQGAHVDIGADEFNGVAPVFTLPVVRVMTSGSDANDGSNWSAAKLTVQSAIDAIVSAGGGEVWVAAGTYPERITLQARVQLYGGFAGTETSRDERDRRANPTILDGGAAGVVVSALAGSAACGVDGFTIRNGKGATGFDPAGVGCYRSFAVISNNTITENISTFGAGVYCATAWSTITDNEIVANGGDGVYCTYGAPLISGNTIAANRADQAALAYGVFCGDYSAPIITGNIVHGHPGTGIYCTFRCSPVITRNTITANVGGMYGGIAVLEGSSAVITDNVVAGNCGSEAGGIYWTNAQATVINNTIVANGGVKAGGVYANNVLSTLTNNIIAFNSSGIYTTYLPSTAAHHNCVYNPDGINYSNMSAGAGDISVDPQLVAAPFGQVHLRAGSPCIDAGDDAAMPAATDIDGIPRPQGAHVDIGAHEFNGTVPDFDVPVFHVRTGGDDSQDGRTWATAKQTVQAAVDAAAAVGGSEVWVAEGVYAQRVQMKTCTYLYGGFAGTEVSREERDWRNRATVLEANSGAATVSAAMKSGCSRLDGFTVRNNPAGGVSCYDAWLTLTNNQIVGNGSATDTNVFGGGIRLTDGATLTLVGNAIQRNAAGVSGGGLYCGDFAVVQGNRNVICGNVAAKGGGVYLTSEMVSTLANSVIVGNATTDRGGGAYLDGSSKLINCTLAGNYAAVGGAAAHTLYSGPTLTNCIAWGNVGSTLTYTSAAPTVSCCDIEGGFSGSSNINAMPLFVRDPSPGADATWGTSDDDYGDLHLQAGSPCIDKGSNYAVPAGVLADLDGHGRFYDDPATSNGGSGIPPIVDMGPYEYIAGDYDHDGDLDFADVLVFQACVSGPGVAFSGDCLKADLNRDGDVDQADFGVLQKFFSGPDRPVNPKP